MSLLGFQRALADLAASPDRCARAIHYGAPAFGEYDLTPRERARLVAMARDRLMATNCVLYRANRITPIYMFLPRTCKVLGPVLRRELDAFWSQSTAADQQYLTETTRFAEFLKSRIASGALPAHLEGIVASEAAALVELLAAPTASTATPGKSRRPQTAPAPDSPACRT
jgi:hypothetical protein